MDREKIKNLLNLDDKTPEDIRADAAAVLIEVDSGVSEIEKLGKDLKSKEDEIKKLKESNIRLYNMVTVPARKVDENPPEKSFNDRMNALIDEYSK